MVQPQKEASEGMHLNISRNVLLKSRLGETEQKKRARVSQQTLGLRASSSTTMWNSLVDTSTKWLLLIIIKNGLFHNPWNEKTTTNLQRKYSQFMSKSVISLTASNFFGIWVCCLKRFFLFYLAMCWIFFIVVVNFPHNSSVLSQTNKICLCRLNNTTMQINNETFEKITILAHPQKFQIMSFIWDDTEVYFDVESYHRKSRVYLLCVGAVTFLNKKVVQH